MKVSRTEFVDAYDMRLCVRHWGDESAPKLFMIHGWMDISASFQFVVDAFKRDWHVIAPDMRGFGHSGWAKGGYWFPDYLADLEALLDRKPKALSGGQRQRVAMGRAIVRNPKVFLMDEPLSNLDAKLRGQMRIEISKLHQRLGTTIIYVTHDQTEAMTLGTRIVVMNAGVVQQVDTPQTLYDYPCNLFVAGFIGSPQMNFVDATCKVQNGKVYLVAGPSEIELPAAKGQKLIDGGYDGKTVVLGIRPEDVHDEPAFLQASPNTVIEAKIRVYEMLGAEVFLYFDYEGASMTARVDPRTTARTGDTVKFALDAEKIHVFDKETEQTITN